MVILFLVRLHLFISYSLISQTERPRRFVCTAFWRLVRYVAALTGIDRDKKPGGARFLSSLTGDFGHGILKKTKQIGLWR